MCVKNLLKDSIHLLLILSERIFTKITFTYEINILYYQLSYRISGLSLYIRLVRINRHFC